MGLLGVDANTTKQTLENNQVTTQSGAAYGSRSRTVGQNASGIFGGLTINTGNRTAGGRAGGSTSASGTTGNVNVNLISNDPATALAAIAANQELSTLAVSTSAQNAYNALAVLQSLNSQHNVAEAGGTAEDVAGVVTMQSGSFWDNLSKTEKIVGTVLAVGVVGYILYRLT